MTYIEELEGSVSTLQGKHEALNGFQTHYDAYRQAEAIYRAEVGRYLGEHGVDPTDEMEETRKARIDTYNKVCGVPSEELTQPLFGFLTEMKVLFPNGVPAPEPVGKVKSKRSTKLNPRQREYLLPLFKQALTTEYQSNEQLQSKVMEALGAKADKPACDSPFFSTSMGGVVDENGKAYRYNGDKTVREIFIENKFGEFTTVPYRMVKEGLAEGKSERVKGEKGEGNKPFYRLMTEKEITEAPPVVQETKQEPEEDWVPEMETSPVDQEAATNSNKDW